MKLVKFNVELVSDPNTALVACAVGAAQAAPAVSVVILSIRNPPKLPSSAIAIRISSISLKPDIELKSLVVSAPMAPGTVKVDVAPLTKELLLYPVTVMLSSAVFTLATSNTISSSLKFPPPLSLIVISFKRLPVIWAYPFESSRKNALNPDKVVPVKSKVLKVAANGFPNELPLVPPEKVSVVCAMD